MLSGLTWNSSGARPAAKCHFVRAAGDYQARLTHLILKASQPEALCGAVSQILCTPRFMSRHHITLRKAAAPKLPCHLLEAL
jgi:hypothetical protein